MKKMIKILSLMLVLTMCLALAACGAKDPDKMVYAVESGSAGEAAALEKGWETVGVDTQAKALMEVAAGTSDAAIIDLLMAGAMIGEGTSYPNLTIAVELSPEEYGVGFRKESDLIAAFNKFWKEACDAGTVMDCAETYGIAQNIIEK